jgi:tRNA-specific 2-thiouridylase
LNVKALSLFSGGLDSLLAAKVVLEQGIEVLAVTFETPFFGAERARAAARKLGLPLRIVNFTDEHLVMLRAPRYGYGRNMNPCIDCHTLMLRKTGAMLAEEGADFIITGEVLGQRPMSQNRQSLHIVAKNSGYPDLIVRPLSAQLLPETRPEREGKLDRQGLLAIQGRGRKTQIELAARFGIGDYAPPAGGCLLTDPIFSRRLRDLFDENPACPVNDIELLKYGRHFRTAEGRKVIVGRNERDNRSLEKLAGPGDAALHVADYPGPLAIVPHGGDDNTLLAAAALCVLYSDAPKDCVVTVSCTIGGRQLALAAAAASREEARALLV